MRSGSCGAVREGDYSRRGRFSSPPALHARLRRRGAQRRGAGAGRGGHGSPGHSGSMRRQVFVGKLFTGFRGENGTEGNSSSELRVPVSNFPAGRGDFVSSAYGRPRAAHSSPNCPCPRTRLKPLWARSRATPIQRDTWLVSSCQRQIRPMVPLAFPITFSM